MRERTAEFLARLDGVVPLKGGSTNEWKALCPCHRDTHPSYEIKEGDRGIVSICRACGATHEQACAVLGVPIADTFWEPLPNQSDADEGVGGSRGVTKGQVVARHVYEEDFGKPVYRVVREHIPSAKSRSENPKGYTKSCKLERWEGGRWVSGLGDATRLLYHQPQLKLTKPGSRVLWVEGENKVEALERAGFVATTAFGGTGGQRQLPDLSWLAGREVWILADDDDPGRSYAQVIRSALLPIAKAAHIAPELPGIREILPKGGDVADWLKAGHTAEELDALLVAPKSPVWQWVKTRQQLRDSKSPTWLIDPMFQEESLILLYGAYAQGKSFIAFDIAMSLTCLDRWFHHPVNRNGPVVYVNADGGPGIADRLRAWEKVNRQVEGFELWTVGAGILLSGGSGFTDFHRFLSELPEHPIMIVYDTLSQCIAGAAENDQGEMSAFIRNVQIIQRDFNCCSMLVHHSNSSGRGPRGSTVIPGAADTIWRCQWVEDNITMICEKQRNGKRFDPHFFRLRTLSQSQSVLVGIDHPGTRQERVMQGIRILAVIAERPGATVSEIMEATGLTERTVRGHINLFLGNEEISAMKLEGKETGGPKPDGYWINRHLNGPWSADQRLE